jgi:hypothetical protein
MRTFPSNVQVQFACPNKVFVEAKNKKRKNILRNMDAFKQRINIRQNRRKYILMGNFDHHDDERRNHVDKILFNFF